MKFKLVSVFFKLSATLKQELDKDMSRKVVGKEVDLWIIGQ